MPTVTPMSLIFKVFSDLSGGLVNDISTVMVAMLVISIIIMGFDYIKEVLDEGMSRRRTNAPLERARGYKNMADNMDDQVSKDYLNAKYRGEIRRASR
jgi:hypothetical protein